MLPSTPHPSSFFVNLWRAVAHWYYTNRTAHRNQQGNRKKEEKGKERKKRAEKSVEELDCTKQESEIKPYHRRGAAVIVLDAVFPQTCDA
jgi:hypothetical protein